MISEALPISIGDAKDIAKGVDKLVDGAKRAGHNGVEGRVEQIRGVTKTGDVRIRETYPDGSRKDITAERVKEYVPEPRNPGTGEAQVKFDKTVPRSEQWPSDATKRAPTASELDQLNE